MGFILAYAYQIWSSWSIIVEKWMPMSNFVSTQTNQKLDGHKRSCFSFISGNLPGGTFHGSRATQETPISPSPDPSWSGERTPVEQKSPVLRAAQSIDSPTTATTPTSASLTHETTMMSYKAVCTGSRSTPDWIATSPAILIVCAAVWSTAPPVRLLWWQEIWRWVKIWINLETATEPCIFGSTITKINTIELLHFLFCLYIVLFDWWFSKFKPTLVYCFKESVVMKFYQLFWTSKEPPEIPLNPSFCVNCSLVKHTHTATD